MENQFPRVLAEGFIHDTEKVFKEQLNWVVDLLRFHPEYKNILNKQDIPAEEKRSLLDGVVKDKVDPQVYNMVLMMASAGRLHLLESVQDEIERMVEGRTHTARGVVESAFDLDDEVLSTLEKRFSDVMGNSVKLEVRKNPDIIGGIIVTINDTVFDGSIRKRLLQLREHILEE